MHNDSATKSYLTRTALIAAFLFFTLLSPRPASAQLEEEMDILRMIYKDQDLVTPTRSPKPISQVAENVTVIDAEEIEAINAHTLTDVLKNVTGVQIDATGGPGSIAYPLIQGSYTRQVRVMVDGISLNTLSDNLVDIGSFPVQQIERIEIIKGPASSSWGSSLGGIINIITKSPDPERRLGGVASASIGERGTGDYRLELTGTSGPLGYYLYTGGLRGDGLTTNTPFDSANIYSKFKWQPTDKATLQLSVFYNMGSRGDGQSVSDNLKFNDTFEYFYLTPSFTYSFTDSLSLDISANVLTKRAKLFLDDLQSGENLNEIIVNELNAGGSARLSWKKGPSALLVGFDYDHGTMDSEAIKDGSQEQEKWAVYANDTFTFWDFAVTPGFRFDHTSTSGGFWSPSLGITYSLLEKTILRAYAARGFSTPSLSSTFGDGFFYVANPDLKEEEVWSYSAGVETSAARYLWLKATYFLHYMSNVITSESVTADTFRFVNSGKQKRQGVEVEARTVPLWDTSLMAGYAFIDAKDRETGERITNVPRQTCSVGIDYRNSDIINATLRGRYNWWDSDPDLNGRFSAMIWDLNLSRSLYERGDLSMELFFTAHNLFNGSQYTSDIYPNPRRWFEGGVKFLF